MGTKIFIVSYTNNIDYDEVISYWSTREGAEKEIPRVWEMKDMIKNNAYQEVYISEATLNE